MSNSVYERREFNGQGRRGSAPFNRPSMPTADCYRPSYSTYDQRGSPTDSGFSSVVNSPTAETVKPSAEGAVGHESRAPTGTAATKDVSWQPPSGPIPTGPRNMNYATAAPEASTNGPSNNMSRFDGEDPSKQPSPLTATVGAELSLSRRATNDTPDSEYSTQLAKVKGLFLHEIVNIQPFVHAQHVANKGLEEQQEYLKKHAKLFAQDDAAKRRAEAKRDDAAQKYESANGTLQARLMSVSASFQKVFELTQDPIIAMQEQATRFVTVDKMEELVNKQMQQLVKEQVAAELKAREVEQIKQNLAVATREVNQHKKIDDLKKKYDILVKENDLLKTEVTTLRADMDRSTDNLATNYDMKFNDMQDGLESVRGDVNQHKKDMKTLETDVFDLGSDVQKLKDQDRQAMKQEIEPLRAQVEECMERVKQTDEQVKTFQEQVESTQSGNYKSISAAERKVEALASQTRLGFQEHANAVESIDKKVAEMDLRLQKEFSSPVTSKVAEQASISLELSQAKERLTAMESRVKSLDVENLRQAFQEAGNQKPTQLAALEGSVQQLGSAKGDLTHIKDDLAMLQDEFNAMKKRLADNESALQPLVSLIRGSNPDNAGIVEQPGLSDRVADIEEHMKSDAGGLAKRVEGLENTISGTFTQLSALNGIHAKTQALEATVSTNKNLMDQIYANFNGRCNALDTQIKALIGSSTHQHQDLANAPSLDVVARTQALETALSSNKDLLDQINANINGRCNSLESQIQALRGSPQPQPRASLPSNAPSVDGRRPSLAQSHTQQVTPQSPTPNTPLPATQQQVAHILNELQAIRTGFRIHVQRYEVHSSLIRTLTERFDYMNTSELAHCILAQLHPQVAALKVHAQNVPVITHNLNTLIKDLKTLAKDHQSLAKDHQSLTKVVTDVSSDVRKADENAQAVDARLNLQSVTQFNVGQEVGALQRQLKDLEKLPEKTNQLQEQLEKQQKLVDEQKERVDEHEQRLDEQVQRLDGQIERTDKLAERVDEQEDMIGGHTEVLDKQASEIGEQAKAIEEQAGSIAKMTKNIDEQGDVVKQHTAMHVRYIGEIGDLKEKYNDVKDLSDKAIKLGELNSTTMTQFKRRNSSAMAGLQSKLDKLPPAKDEVDNWSRRSPILIDSDEDHDISEGHLVAQRNIKPPPTPKVVNPKVGNSVKNEGAQPFFGGPNPISFEESAKKRRKRDREREESRRPGSSMPVTGGSSSAGTPLSQGEDTRERKKQKGNKGGKNGFSGGDGRRSGLGSSSSR